MGDEEQRGIEKEGIRRKIMRKEGMGQEGGYRTGKERNESHNGKRTTWWRRGEDN